MIPLFKTDLSVRSSNDQNVNTIDFSFLEGSSLVFTPLLWGWSHDDPLLSVCNILFVLTAQHAFDGCALVLLDDLVDDLCDIPVLGSSLDSPHGNLSGIVRSLDDIGRGALGLGREDNGLGVRDGVTVKLDTEHDLDDISILQNNLWVRRQWRDVRNDIVDRNRGGESDTCLCQCHPLVWVPNPIFPRVRLCRHNVPFWILIPFLALFHNGATVSLINLSPLRARDQQFGFHRFPFPT